MATLRDVLNKVNERKADSAGEVMREGYARMIGEAFERGTAQSLQQMKVIADECRKNYEDILAKNNIVSDETRSLIADVKLFMADMKTAMEPPADDDLGEETKRHESISTSIAFLTSRLSEIEKKIDEKPRREVLTLPPQPIVPSFVFKPVHDQDGRIISVTATPVKGG